VQTSASSVSAGDSGCKYSKLGNKFLGFFGTVDVVSNSHCQFVLYGLHTGSELSDLPGFRRIAAGFMGMAFSFWFLSERGSGVCLRIESVKLPCVSVSGGDCSVSVVLGMGGEWGLAWEKEGCGSGAA